MSEPVVGRPVRAEAARVREILETTDPAKRVALLLVDVWCAGLAVGHIVDETEQSDTIDRHERSARLALESVEKLLAALVADLERAEGALSRVGAKNNPCGCDHFTGEYVVCKNCLGRTRSQNDIVARAELERVTRQRDNALRLTSTTRAMLAEARVEALEARLRRAGEATP